MFGNARIITAPLDRLTHHGHIIETGNDSFRPSDSTAKPKSRTDEASRAALPQRHADMKNNIVVNAPWHFANS